MEKGQKKTHLHDAVSSAGRQQCFVSRTIAAFLILSASKLEGSLAEKHMFLSAFNFHISNKFRRIASTGIQIDRYIERGSVERRVGGKTDRETDRQRDR